MIAFGLARTGQTPQLQALWKTCFGDDESYTRRFFARYNPLRHAFAATEGDAVLAMTMWLPQTLRADGRRYPAAYLYAVATDPAHRGKGLCRDLLGYAQDTLARHGAACTTLVPSSESLFDFYAKLGYQTAFSCDQWEQEAGQTPAVGMRARPISDREYVQMRQAVLPACSAEWDATALRYQSALCSQSGGGFFALSADGCAICERTEQGLFVKELLLPPEARRAGVQALLAETDTHRALARAPMTNPNSPDAHAFGMARWLIPDAPALQNAYLGLAFD